MVTALRTSVAARAPLLAGLLLLLSADVDAQFAEEDVLVAERPVAQAAKLDDERLEPQTAILGIVVADEPRAYAVSDLETAGGVVHDLVSGSRIDVGMDGGEAGVVRTDSPIRERRTTSWGEWVRLHPDSSLWRPAAIAEPEARRSSNEVQVTESHHYNTAFGCALVPVNLTSSGPKPPGLFVISGTIENVAKESVHHVVLRYELVDDDGTVVYRDEGFNRSAEALAAPRLTNAGAVIPIDSGKTDTFRMIFLSDELPQFASTRVTIARVY